MLAGIESARGDYLGGRTRLCPLKPAALEGEMPYAFGPPFVDWPSSELLGELLLKGTQICRCRGRISKRN